MPAGCRIGSADCRRPDSRLPLGRATTPDSLQRVATTRAPAASMVGMTRSEATLTSNRRLLVILALAGLVATACTPGQAISRSDSNNSLASPATGSSASPVPGETQVGGEEMSAAVSDALTRIPKFPSTPAPVAVSLPHEPARAAWTVRIPTTQPVAFITIDDGRVKHPDTIAFIKAANIPVTFFLTTNWISDDIQYFAQLRDAGAAIESHTVSHPRLPTLPYDNQRHELCHATDLLEEWYGQRPLYFRPPHGAQNDDTLRAAWSCGLKAGFGWQATVTNGVVRYLNPEKKLQPGDIILLHLRESFLADLIAALEAIHAAGLTPGLLQDYVIVE